MVAMELIRANERHIRLHCPCSKEFWTLMPSVDVLISCPSCKELWSGKLIRHYKVKVALKLADDLKTVFVIKAESIGNIFAQIVEHAPLLLPRVAQFCIEEITVGEYQLTEREQIDKNLNEFMNDDQS